jgi:UDP-N-acetylmuramyl pentapeptide synthase
VALAVGATVINDCDAASPLSIRAALKDLAAHDLEGRRVAELGDMLEVGAEEQRLHRRVGEAAVVAGVDVLVTGGPTRSGDARCVRRRVRRGRRRGRARR